MKLPVYVDVDPRTLRLPWSRRDGADPAKLARQMSRYAMTTPARKDLLAVLVQLSEVCPEMRFGQLVANLSTLAKGLSAEALWDVEDDELLAAARKQLEYFREHRSTVA